MEFDCYQHYFYDGLDTEEDFYKSTAPSEDIWKKFELLPTPPMSPTRTLSGACPRGHLSAGDKQQQQHLLSPGDKLSWLSKVLGQDEECEGQFLPDTEELFGINLSSIIIQDCMWSSFSASKQLEKVNERLSSSSSSAAAHQGAVRVPPAAAPQISVRAGKAHCASSLAPPNASLSRTLASDCVDPASVLTIPAAAVASSCRKLPAASSGSESHSDSSDEDEDEEDDEEIDVVTVESKQNRARLVRARKPMTVTVRADPCPKRFHLSVHRQQHNYAARSPDSEPGEEEEDDDDEEEEEYDDEPQCKRTFVESCQQQRATAHSPSTSSLSQSTFSTDSQSSDAEDTDRRRNHNFLERKRRNDLRSRFLALRDQVPGLVESAKTPKVAILTQATEYLAQLHTREKHQVLEKKRLKARQQQLLRKLAELKRS